MMLHLKLNKMNELQDILPHCFFAVKPKHLKCPTLCNASKCKIHFETVVCECPVQCPSKTCVCLFRGGDLQENVHPKSGVCLPPVNHLPWPILTSVSGSGLASAMIRNSAFQPWDCFLPLGLVLFCLCFVLACLLCLLVSSGVRLMTGKGTAMLDTVLVLSLWRSNVFLELLLL